MDQKILAALLETITPLQETEAYAKVLIYGESGTGKTVLACDFGEKVILVDSANGWVSLKNHENVMSKVRRIQYQGLSQIDALSDAIIEGKLECDTLVLDEASSMAMQDLDTVLKARSAKDANKDPSVPTQPDFFSNTERVRRTLSRAMRLPCNVVLTAHVREDRDERTGKVFTRPAFTPKMRQTIVQECHMVGYLTANEITKDEDETEYRRRLQVQPTASITAKTRIGGLPTVIDAPNLNSIFAEWQKGIVASASVEVVQEPDAVVTESANEDESISIGE
jgi:hypothetical protein